MTCVVGLVQDGTAWLGADSACTWDGSVMRSSLHSNPKVFRVGPLLIGYCGSGRQGRVLQYGLQPPPHRRGITADRYVSTVLVDAARKAFNDAGVLSKHDNVEVSGGDFLVGYRGRLWRVDDDFNADEPVNPFDAVGCGAVIALGAMSVTPKAAPRQRILGALKAAAQFSAGVRGPFTVLELGTRRT